MYFMPNVWVLEFRCSQAGGKSLPMSLWIMAFPSRTDSAGMVSVMTSHGHICLSPGGHPAQWPFAKFWAPPPLPPTPTPDQSWLCRRGSRWAWKARDVPPRPSKVGHVCPPPNDSDWDGINPDRERRVLPRACTWMINSALWRQIEG